MYLGQFPLDMVSNSKLRYFLLKSEENFDNLSKVFCSVVNFKLSSFFLGHPVVTADFE